MSEIFNYGIKAEKRSGDLDDPFKQAFIYLDAPANYVFRGGTRTFTHGFDFSAGTFTNEALSFPGFKLTNAGEPYVSTSGKGLIIKDSDGAGCHRITVNGAGTISAASTSCP